jgi:hypothetical protein
MRFVILLALFFSACLSTLPSAPGPLQVRHDKFTQTKSISTQGAAVFPVNNYDGVNYPASFRPNISISALAYYKGDSLTEVSDRVLLSIRCMSTDWQFLRYHDLWFMVDGEGMRFETDHDGSVGGGYVTESISTWIPTDTFKRIVAAPQVEGKIAVWPFVLPAVVHAELKMLAEKI